MFKKGMQVILGSGVNIEFIPSPNFSQTDEYCHFENKDTSIGEIRYINFIHHNFKVWLAVYKLSNDTKLKVKYPSREKIALVYSLGEDVFYGIEGLFEGTALHGYYNVFHAPEAEVNYEFKKDLEYIFLGVDFKVEALKELGVATGLADLIKDAESSIPSKLGEEDFFITYKLNWYLSQLKNILITANINYGLLVTTKVFELTLESFEQSKFPKDAEAREFQRITDFIAKELRTVDTSEVRTMFEISATRLLALFRKYASCDTATFIRNQRLERAKEMIDLDDKIQIKQIALEVGYSSGSNFALAFRRKFGLWPMEYRSGKAPGHNLESSAVAISLVTLSIDLLTDSDISFILRLCS